MVQGNYGPKPPDEKTFHARMSDFLHEQGELDDGDISSIQNWLRSAPEMLEADWSAIIHDLRRQGYDDLISQIQSRQAPRIEEAVSAVLASTNTEGRWAILVGAGGSKPPPTEIPTVAELLDRLWEKAEEINAPSLLNLKARCVELKITNIEDLLTAIELAQDAASNPPVALLVGELLFPPGTRAPAIGTRRSGPIGPIGPEVMETLSESSQILFSVLVGMMKDQRENPIHCAIAKRVTAKKDVIITTNYDVCIERALGEDSYDYGLDPMPPNPEKILILKLHGSLSWYVCKSCDGYVAASLTQLDAASQAKLYPVVAMCDVCAATAQQLIVPPISAKSADHPALLAIRQRTEDVFSEAPVVVVVGYSFSESDHYLARMIARAVRSKPNKMIVVFDVSAAPYTRLKKFLAAHTRGTGFDTEKQLLPILGPAEEILPQFLDMIAAGRPAGEQAAPTGNGSSTRVAAVS